MKKFLSLFVILFLTGCAAYPVQKEKIVPTPYRLNIGDEVKIRVYDEPELSGTYLVDSNGSVTLPLIGKVGVYEQTERQALQGITDAYRRGGYLRNPRIVMDVTTMKPIFVLGEINKPGSFPFQNGLTVYQAVALAGGYTYRADREDVIIRRASSTAPVKVREETTVQPGDTIEIGERYF